jgi:hypothetical protein
MIFLKRFALFSVAVVLGFAFPFITLAEGNSDLGSPIKQTLTLKQEPPGSLTPEIKTKPSLPLKTHSLHNEAKQERVQEQGLLIHDLKLLPKDAEENQYLLWIDASVNQAAKAKGTWTVAVANHKTYQFAGHEGHLNKTVDLGGGENYTVTIRFRGEADGHGKEFEKSVKIPVPKLKAVCQSTNGKPAILGRIEHVKNAGGNWWIGIGKDTGKKLLNKAEATSIQGVSYTYPVELKPGDYVVDILFDGKVDGNIHVFLAIGNKLKVIGGGQGTISKPIAPPTKDQSGKQSKHSNPSTVLNPSEGSDVLKQAKGGKLPITATTYPSGMLIGLLLAVAGGALLHFSQT